MGKKFKEIVYYIRRPDDRRKVEDRRLLVKQEYIEHNPERRVNMIHRRVHSDRRGLSSDIKNTSWKKAF